MTCSRCRVRFTTPVLSHTGRWMCPVCVAPLTRSDRKQFRRQTRRLNAVTIALTDIHEQFDRADPGNPLGVGMPLGATMREDGDSHREGWMRVIRRDPCSFCAGAGGTVDHIEPQARRARGIGGVHSWVNYAGACESCNSKKGSMPLLEFLGRRAGQAWPMPAWAARQMRDLAA